MGNPHRTHDLWQWQIVRTGGVVARVHHQRTQLRACKFKFGQKIGGSDRWDRSDRPVFCSSASADVGGITPLESEMEPKSLVEESERQPDLGDVQWGSHRFIIGFSVWHPAVRSHGW